MNSIIKQFFVELGLNIPIPTYNHLFIFMVVTGFIFVLVQAKRFSLPLMKTAALSLLLIFICLVGGRIFGILNHLVFYSEKGWADKSAGNPGAFIFGTITIIALARFFHISASKYLNLITPGLAWALFWGRLGCLMDGCCYGSQTNLPWGVCFPRGSLPYIHQCMAGTISPYDLYTRPIHPTQIYELFFCLLMFIITLHLFQKNKNYPVFALFLMLYSLFRVGIDFLRGDPAVMLGSLRIHQITFLFLFFLAAGYLMINHFASSRQRLNNSSLSIKK